MPGCDMPSGDETDDAVVDTAGAIAEMIDLGTDLAGRYLIDRDDLCASDHPGPNSPALPFAEAAPMACAGVTTFDGLRQARAKAGGLVAVPGMCGLGHLGVQFSRPWVLKP